MSFIADNGVSVKVLFISLKELNLKSPSIILLEMTLFLR